MAVWHHMEVLARGVGERLCPALLVPLRAEENVGLPLPLAAALPVAPPLALAVLTFAREGEGVKLPPPSIGEAVPPPLPGLPLGVKEAEALLVGEGLLQAVGEAEGHLLPVALGLPPSLLLLLPCAVAEGQAEAEREVQGVGEGEGQALALPPPPPLLLPLAAPPREALPQAVPEALPLTLLLPVTEGELEARALALGEVLLLLLWLALPVCSRRLGLCTAVGEKLGLSVERPPPPPPRHCHWAPQSSCCWLSRSCH